jgi:hypothetical protein
MPNPVRAGFAGQEAIAAKVSLIPFNGALYDRASTFFSKPGIPSVRLHDRH